MSQRRYDIENLPSAPVSLGRVKDSMMLWEEEEKRNQVDREELA